MVKLPQDALQPGDVVTISYDNYTRTAGIVNPEFVRARNDIAWEEVVDSFSLQELTLNGYYNLRVTLKFKYVSLFILRYLSENCWIHN